MAAHRGFNPRSRTGNDAACTRRCLHIAVSFNPRSRTGNDKIRCCFISSSTASFNPRSRTGNDLCYYTLRVTQNLFQSTFPHGERRWEDRDDRANNTRFNPRSRTGNDMSSVKAISGATGFNPRSRTGNDAGNTFAVTCVPEFQSTFPHGERPVAGQSTKFYIQVSIHVPARGTTWDQV